MTMTHAIDTVFIDAILVPLLRELGLPKSIPLAKLSPSMQKWVPGEAEWLQRDTMSHPTFAVLVADDESYLNINNVDENDLDAEQERVACSVSSVDDRGAGRVGDVRHRD
jgi:hypothetical protein